jgi:two-component system invasion response regulator UvrY
MRYLEMIRLAIADDHPVLREGLKQILSQCRDIRVVREFGDADALLEALNTEAPDVILLDVAMPGPGVLEVIRRVKTGHPGVRVLILSVHPEEHYALRVLRAGADGYLMKTHSPQELPKAIRHVYSGRKYVTSSVAEEMAVGLSRGPGGPPHEALSNREYEVFLRLGSGLSIEDIAQELGLSRKTVSTYRSRIVEKTKFGSTAEMIFYAVNHGLVTEVRNTGTFRRRIDTR